MATDNESSKHSFPSETLTATAESALDALNSAGERAEQLVQAWIQANNADAVQEAAEHGAGKARKAARRGLNILKSRGVAIPPRRKVQLKQQLTPELQALMLPPDAGGTSVFVITKTYAGGRCEACFVTLSDTAGVYRIERADSTTGKIKAALARGNNGLTAKPVPVPLEWARLRIADARKLHAASKVPEPLGFDSSKDLLTPLPSETLEHPFDGEGFEFADEDAKELASESGALHHIAEFASWMPTQSAINEMLQAVGKRIAESRGDEEEPAQSEQESAVGEHLRTAMLEATDRYFNEEVRAALVNRMKDAALGVLTHRGEAEALKVAATIQAIKQCGLVTNPPRDVPFLRAFFEKAVSLLMMQQGGQLQIPVPKKRASEAETAAL